MNNSPYRKDSGPGKDDPNEEVSHFIVQGVSLGTASLTFTATSVTGRSATSEPKDIQVFPPLRLDPRIVVLVRGATFQVKPTNMLTFLLFLQYNDCRLNLWEAEMP